ncbi:hypothetical protein BDP81DRAFT_402224 [Colletotrichum phormii]|uniref:Secreted protein n=1 Tax=Colletotrichum phormii TaxID=359342 RepID=A0AAJ0A4M5_9PEZI|nr:uncharacterized protein BDP81DRAFT_402224 [Colletotrichum phormii]KAK1656398.1 hypothetical protein BDP81DRAFT_402224 [Colletotrichum phormii]
MYLDNLLVSAALICLASAEYTTKYLTGSSNNTIQVLVEGDDPSLLVWPSFARDSLDDFHEFSTTPADAGYRYSVTPPANVWQRTWLPHSEKVPSIVLACINTGTNTNATIAATANIASHYTYSAEERLAALELGYFAPGHNASLWLTGWYLEAMGSVTGAPTSTTIGSNNTQILDVIATLDPWRREDQWN